jgi:hypothetical protein
VTLKTIDVGKTFIAELTGLIVWCRRMTCREQIEKKQSKVREDVNVKKNIINS